MARLTSIPRYYALGATTPNGRRPVWYFRCSPFAAARVVGCRIILRLP